MNQQSEVTQQPTQDGGGDRDCKRAEIQAWLKARVAEITALEPDDINVTISFERYGLDSSDAIVLSGDLQDWLECDLEPELLFDYPTIETLSEYLVESDAQPSSTDGGGDRLEAKPEDNSAEAPLSHGQRALWFVQKLAPENYAYNVAFTARIRSPLDTALLQRIFQKLTDRHPMLRATFLEKDGEPYQKIHEQWEVCFEEIDASPWGENELTQEALAAHQRPFSLEQGPLLRVSLFNRSEQERLLLISLHHIICDGWSVWMLLDELRVLYQAEQENVSPLLPPLKSTYLDYVRAQSDLLANAEEEKLWHYWQQQLAGELPVLNLPTDRPRPPVSSYRGASHSFRLPVPLTEQLKELAESQGTSLYMLLLGAFQVLLHRYTNQDDILVGSPMKCRNQPQWAGTFGYFVNPVVLRADLSKNPQFTSFLSQVRRTVLEAIAHQDYPFPLLVERLQPERASSHSPLFQTMFILQKPQKSGDILDLFADEGRVNWGGIELESFDIPQQEGQFDLTLEMMDAQESVIGVFKYDTDLFDEATIARLESHFQTLLAGIVARPEQPVSHLPLLSKAERHQLLVEWNQTQADYPQLCLHELFEAQVERTPDAVALVFSDQQLTYRELNQRSNQLARYLQTLGVGPEVLVGLCLERSVDMIVGILGVLKAGGAYVPLDPTYPQERLAYMLHDSQAPVLLTQEKLTAVLPNDEGRIVCIDTETHSLSQSQDNLSNEATIDSLAYVIYTSGSTGKPKGVLVTHRGLGNLSQAQQDTFSVSSNSRVLQFASLSFDASVYEIVMALCSGASLHLATRDALLPGTPLVQTLRQSSITHVTLPPSALAVMPNEELPLQTLAVAGEACSPQLVKQWSSGRRFLNAYGPTEATVCATVAQVSDGDPPPIGRPLPNTELYILDRYRQPVPLGVRGELYIGGVGLARGYHNRPELTQQKFIPHPFSNKPEARLYKTGDWVRYRPDGNIEFLGRIDHQVKIRGFRIELGEIEAVLTQHPEVREAAVIVREDSHKDKRLVAYVVLHHQPVDLRSFLAEKLPDYLVPNAFVVLESLPLTPNGKIDRRALPAPSDPPRAIVAPRTATEKALSAIWAEVLGVEAVGIYDSFFEMGGHSLLATQLISRLQSALSIELPVSSLFDAPTIAALSTRIDAAQARAVQPVLQSVPRSKAPLSFAQERTWTLTQSGSRGIVDHIPFALHLSGTLNIAALQQTLEEIVRRHAALRTTFETRDGAPVQIIHPSRAIALPTLDLQELPIEKQQAEVQRLTLQEAQRPFDLAQSPLRVTLLKLAPAEHILVVSVHHIVADGWSMGIFFRELAALYRGFCTGIPSSLPEVTVQYADYAHWQRQWSEEVLAAKLSYWQQRLAGAPLVLKLPADRSRPDVPTHRGAQYPLTLSEALTQNLKLLSQREEVTLFVTLLSAYALLLRHFSGQSDLVIGSPVANRDRLEIENTFGWFANLLPLRVQCDDVSCRAFLSQVKEVVKEAFDRQDVPFAKIVEMQPQPPTGYSPVVQVEFALQNDPTAGFELPGLTVAGSAIDKQSYARDLALHVWETPHGLNGFFAYSTDLFDESTIAQMSDRIQHLLQSLVAAPDQPLTALMQRAVGK